MNKNSKCIHNKREIACKKCGGSQICEHNRQRSTCIPCGGGSVCVHKKQKSTCRVCDLLGWAKGYISISKYQAKRFGYTAPKITADELVALISYSKKCCGCEEPLYWSGQTPCLHHNHETGNVIGFAHRFCNTLEGFLVKLGPKRMAVLLKNFFPEQVSK